MRIQSGAALAVAALLLAPPAWGQGQPGFIPTRPPAGRKEVRGLDFRPNGGLRVQYRALMARRQAMLAAHNIQGANALQRSSGFPDSLNVPVIFLYFKNGAIPFDTVNYQDVFFATAPASRPYSLRSYYRDLSTNRFDLTGTMFDWVQLSQDSSYYAANCRAIYCGLGMAHLYQGLVEAITADTAGVDWAQYDANDDGVVDFVIFVQPLIGGECKGAGTTGNNIWAHRYSLTGAAQSGGVIGGGAFVTNSPWPGHPGQFIKIDDYTVQSGQGGTGSCTAGQVMPIGTVAHETGHTFGLPDLYDTDNNASTATEGIGNWGLMGSGNYTVPQSPSFFDAWSRFYMGWATFDTISTSATTTLGPVETSDTVLYVASTSPSEYYLLENRQPLKSDSGMTNPNLGGQLRGPGLLVWHVDQAIVNAGIGSNDVNSQVAHGGDEGVELVQADGLNQLRTPGGGNRGDPGDPFPGSTTNRTLGYTTNPNLILHDGGLAGFKIDSIYQVSTDGPVTFRFLKNAPWVVSSTQAPLGAMVIVNGDTAVTYKELFAIGDSVRVSAADSQLVNSGRTRFTFPTSGNRWSNGQTGKSFAVAASGTPDSINALFNVQHRVKVVVTGLGTVSGPTGDTTAAGAFVAAGTSTPLIATPDSGKIFNGWSGDTATTNPTLTLPMNRPYNVTATFSGAVAVSVTGAASALLGVDTLTSQQKTYLDQVGNANAVYDLGDFLALLKAKGVIPAPALHGSAPTRSPARPAKER